MPQNMYNLLIQDVLVNREKMQMHTNHSPTDHYLVVAKVRERLAVRKQAALKSDGERFNEEAK